MFGKETRHFKNTSGPVLCSGEFKISQLNERNFLGLTVDRHLNWDHHVPGKYALSKLRHLCNIDILKMVYFSNIHSKISFGIILYGATSSKKL